MFYHKLGLNWWKATLTFFSKRVSYSEINTSLKNNDNAKFLTIQMVKRLYQDSSNSLPATDLKFSGGVIKLSMATIWQLSQYQQVCIMLHGFNYANV